MLKTFVTIDSKSQLKQSKEVSIPRQASNIVKMHGFTGLYKGLGMTMSSAIPFVAIKMATFDYMMQNQSRFIS